MQLTKQHHNPTRGMDYIFRRLTENAKTRAVKLPVVEQHMSAFIEDLLTPEEQKLCDMATD